MSEQCAGGMETLDAHNPGIAHHLTVSSSNRHTCLACLWRHAREPQRPRRQAVSQSATTPQPATISPHPAGFRQRSLLPELPQLPLGLAQPLQDILHERHHVLELHVIRHYKGFNARRRPLPPRRRAPRLSFQLSRFAHAGARARARARTRAADAPQLGGRCGSTGDRSRRSLAAAGRAASFYSLDC